MKVLGIERILAYIDSKFNPWLSSLIML